jgi:hypothetical protein
MLKIEDNLSINNARLFYKRLDTRATRAVKNHGYMGFLKSQGYKKELRYYSHTLVRKSLPLNMAVFIGRPNDIKIYKNNLQNHSNRLMV